MWNEDFLISLTQSDLIFFFCLYTFVTDSLYIELEQKWRQNLIKELWDWNNLRQEFDFPTFSLKLV